MTTPEPEHCQQCGRELKPGAEVWLELDSRTGKYHLPGNKPIECSQGEFAFGADCARRVIPALVDRILSGLPIPDHRTGS